MCGRYFIEDKETAAQMLAILDALNRKNTPVKTGEIFPGDRAGVIAPGKSLSPAPFAMRWGYGVAGKRIINARSETAAQKPLFADGVRRRRCLVPASGYYEWTRRSREKTKYAIRSVSSPMIYMAGLYRIADGEAEFTILTREPGEGVAFLHDRMPVILPAALAGDWLSPEADAASVLCRAVTEVAFEPVPGQAQTLSFL